MSSFFVVPMVAGSGEFPQWCEVGECGVDEVDGHAKGFGDGLDGFEGDGILPGFDAGDVGALEPGSLGELLLAEPCQLAEGGDAHSDAVAGVLFLLFGHSESVFWFKWICGRMPT